MSWKAIETAREIRMWTVQIIAPTAFVAACYFYENPDKLAKLKNKINRSIRNVEETILDSVNNAKFFFTHRYVR